MMLHSLGDWAKVFLTFLLRDSKFRKFWILYLGTNFVNVKCPFCKNIQSYQFHDIQKTFKKVMAQKPLNLGLESLNKIKSKFAWKNIRWKSSQCHQIWYVWIFLQNGLLTFTKFVPSFKNQTFFNFNSLNEKSKKCFCTITQAMKHHSIIMATIVIFFLRKHVKTRSVREPYCVWNIDQSPSQKYFLSAKNN